MEFPLGGVSEFRIVTVGFDSLLVAPWLPRPIESAEVAEAMAFAPSDMLANLASHVS